MKISRNQYSSICNKLFGKANIPWEDWTTVVGFTLPVLRQPEFLAQCAYESNYFRSNQEDLNYSSAKRILQVFGSRIKKEHADALTNNPRALAKDAYLDHPHLGNNSKEAKELYSKGWEVWDFRGQGYIQLTGFYNWKRFQKETGINCFSDKEFFIKRPWLASAYFWKLNDLDYEVDMKEMTKKINGGLNGYKERVETLKSILKIMSKNR